MKTEPARLSDAPRLRQLMEQLEGTPCQEPAFSQVLEQMLARPEYTLAVVRDEAGEAIATAMGILCLDLAGEGRPFMLIENVAVEERHRGSGAGRRVMAYLEDVARRRHCCYTMLVSGSQRTGAHRFYERLGYPPDRARGFKKDL